MDQLQLQLPMFDGDTYDHKRDHQRLGSQLTAVRTYMEGRGFVTLQQISKATGHSVQSVSARIRDLRKAKFGGRTVNRESKGRGLFAYKLEPLQ